MTPRTSISSDSFQNSFSDVFSDSPPPSPSTTTQHHIADPSDIPRLRSIHVTAGYRDGIASAKDEAVQHGFDEAYPLGAIMGMRAGYILGVLEGLCHLGSSRDPQSHVASERESQGDASIAIDNRRLRGFLIQAKEELMVSNLFGKDYWKSDGLWEYQVEGREEDVTFWEVADQHPVIRKWLGTIRDEVQKAGLQGLEEGFPKAGLAKGEVKLEGMIDNVQAENTRTDQVEAPH
ncbi:MAG: hypothetical protein Q9174_000763 [Haloplaca sp. 1 TL-2023]